MQDRSLADELPPRATMTPASPMLPSGIRPYADIRYERLYDPGQAPVYPLTHPDPMRALADWGAEPTPPEPPYALDDERSYISPGPPPWVNQDERELAVQHFRRACSKRRTPAWAAVSLLAGSTMLFVVTVWAVSALVA